MKHHVAGRLSVEGVSVVKQRHQKFDLWLRTRSCVFFNTLPVPLYLHFPDLSWYFSAVFTSDLRTPFWILPRSNREIALLVLHNNVSFKYVWPKCFIHKACRNIPEASMHSGTDGARVRTLGIQSQSWEKHQFLDCFIRQTPLLEIHSTKSTGQGIGTTNAAAFHCLKKHAASPTVANWLIPRSFKRATRYRNRGCAKRSVDTGFSMIGTPPAAMISKNRRTHLERGWLTIVSIMQYILLVLSIEQASQQSTIKHLACKVLCS